MTVLITNKTYCGESIKIYKSECGNCETAEQITFFNEIRREYPALAAIAIHPRNEGKRSYAQAEREKREGMKKGASDIIIPARVPFVCEMKASKTPVTKEQKEYLAASQSMGAFACVSYGYKAALYALKYWSDTYDRKN